MARADYRLAMVRFITAALAILACACPSASATPSWVATAKGGVTAFGTSASLALPHVLHPSFRLEGTSQLSPRLEMGVELGAVIADHESYVFESVNLVMRTPLYDGDLFDMRLGWGFGLGTGPPILQDDLTGGSPVVPTLQVSLGFRWEIVDDAVDIGLEIIDEQLKVLTGALTLSVKR